MAVRYFCDRCGEEVRTSVQLTKVGYSPPTRYYKHFISLASLCQSCYLVVKEFLRAAD